MLKKFLIVLMLVCTGFAGYATTDIQPNGNLSGGNTAANCTQPVLGTYSGSTNFEAKWRANDISLRWYNEGARITTVQNTEKTCSYDGVLNIPATAPSRTGYTFGGWKVTSGIPEGYTELEYIQSSGTQYINTGITSTPDTFFTLVVRFESSGSGYRFFGNANAIVGFGANANSLFVIGQSTPVTSDASFMYGQKSTIRYKGTNVNINGTNFACARAANGPAMTINARADSLTTRVASGKWYHVQIGNGTTVQGDFYPAKRNSDNAVGMFDTVTQTFFPNLGTGSFTAGPALD